MKNRPSLRLSLSPAHLGILGVLGPLAALGLVAASFPAAVAPEPVRLIRASLAVDGELVLQGSTSDDGSPDADAVWGYLEQLELHPTEAFASLGIQPDATSATLGWLRSRENEALGQPPELSLEVRYGGTDAPFVLQLVRDADASTWRIARESLERRFTHRRITRAQAALLAAPERRR